MDSECPKTYSQIMKRKISSMIQEAVELRENNKPQLAISRLTRAIALQPTNPQLFQERAEVYLDLKDYESAIPNFRKAMSLAPGKREELSSRLAGVYFLYGQALSTEHHKDDRALEMFTRASECNPDVKEYTMRKISCLLNLQRYNECLVLIMKELEEDASSPDLYVLRAHLNLMFGDTTQAYHDVCRVLELDERHSDALMLLRQLEGKGQQCRDQAVGSMLVGKKVDALKKITTAIENNPSVADYHVFRGAVYRRLGDYTSAVDDFLLGMDKCGHQLDSPTYTNASRQLTLTYNDFAVECFGQGHFSEAITLLNKAIKEEKREKGFYVNRGDCFYQLSNLHFALADYRQALELAPVDWTLRCRCAVVSCELALLALHEGRLGQAHELFSAAIDGNPKVSRFYVCRARASHEMKDTVGAREDLITALLLDPDNQETLSIMARVFPGKSKSMILREPSVPSIRAKLEANLLSFLALVKQQGGKEEGHGLTDEEIVEAIGISLKLREDSSTDQTLADIHPAPEAERLCPCEGEGEGEGGARGWPVLLEPLPPASSTALSYEACARESKFHKMIYYSKKQCVEEVQRLLRSPPDLESHLPKPRRTQDMKIGTRTITAKRL